MALSWSSISFFLSSDIHPPGFIYHFIPCFKTNYHLHIQTHIINWLFDIHLNDSQLLQIQYHSGISPRICCCLVPKLCPTVCNPMDCSPPGSSVHGISQGRMLAWVAISFSRQCMYIVLQFSFLYLTFHCGCFIFHDGTFISLKVDPNCLFFIQQ